LVEVRGEEMGERMAAGVFTGDLVVYVYQSHGFVPSNDVYNHGGSGCHRMCEVVDDGDDFVDLCFDVADNEATFMGLMGWVVYLVAVVSCGAEDLCSHRVSIRSVGGDGAVPGLLDKKDVCIRGLKERVEEGILFVYVDGYDLKMLFRH
jgi:hypothetical protein